MPHTDIETLHSHVTDGLELPVMEAFGTLQGEGFHVGTPAWFIRLGGCDVGCVWCDVKDSWEAGRWPLRSIEELVKEAVAQPARLAVITGGEPSLYPLQPLCDALHTAGFRVHIETSGTNTLNGELDWITYSPKKFKAALPEVALKAHEIKVVVYHPSDLDWALEQAAGVKADCLRFLQPEWSRRERMTPLILEFVRSHPEWRLSLQTHKYLGIP